MRHKQDDKNNKYPHEKKLKARSTLKLRPKQTQAI